MKKVLTTALGYSNIIALTAAMAAKDPMAGAHVPPPKPEAKNPQRKMTPEELAEEFSKRMSALKDGVDTYNKFRKALNNGWKEFDVSGFVIASGNRKSANKVFKQLLAEAGLRSIPGKMPEEIRREEEYESALLRFGEIRDAKEGTPEATEAAMLSIRIYEYEKKTGKGLTNVP